MGYTTGYYCAIQLSAGLSASSLSGYSAWISAESVSAAVLASVQANARSDLHDVRFSSDADGNNLLPHFLIHADAANDEWAFFVRLNYTGATAAVIYMHWGDASLTSDASSATAFGSDVVAAWCPRDAFNLADLSGNGHDLSISGTVSFALTVDPPSGAMGWTTGSAGELVSTGQDFGSLLNGTSCSIEAHVRLRADSNGWLFGLGNTNGTANRYLGAFWLAASDLWELEIKYANPPSGVNTLTLSTGLDLGWTYAAAVYNASGPTLAGRVLNTTVGPTSVTNVGTSATDFALFNNLQASDRVSAECVWAILRNSAVSADWQLAGKRLVSEQTTYVSYSATVSAHTAQPTGTLSAGASAGGGFGAGAAASTALPLAASAGAGQGARVDALAELTFVALTDEAVAAVAHAVAAVLADASAGDAQGRQAAAGVDLASAALADTELAALADAAAAVLAGTAAGEAWAHTAAALAATSADAEAGAVLAAQIEGQVLAALAAGSSAAAAFLRATAAVADLAAAAFADAAQAGRAQIAAAMSAQAAAAALYTAAAAGSATVSLPADAGAHLVGVTTLLAAVAEESDPGAVFAAAAGAPAGSLDATALAAIAAEARAQAAAAVTLAARAGTAFSGASEAAAGYLIGLVSLRAAVLATAALSPSMSAEVSAGPVLSAVPRLRPH